MNTKRTTIYQRSCKPNEKSWVLSVVVLNAKGEHVGGLRREFHMEEQARAEAAALGLEVQS